jgi:pumilio family protein 6
VLDRFLQKCASPAQLNLIKASITEKHGTELIENLVVRAIEKELHGHILSLHLLNLALPDLVPVEREKIILYFSEVTVPSYLKRKEGA